MAQTQQQQSKQTRKEYVTPELEKQQKLQEVSEGTVPEVPAT
ncbi:MAG: hypothetical protein ACP5HU_01570 [Phycisphaerae bacterium]